MKREVQMESRWPFLANASLPVAEALAAVRAKSDADGLEPRSVTVFFREDLGTIGFGPVAAFA